MAETSATFDFEDGVQGWSGTAGSGDSTVARYQDGGGDWCFRHRLSGRNKGPDNNYAQVSGTWADLFPSLPAGAQVTGVRFGGWNDQCDEFNVVAEARFSDATGTNQNAVQYRGTSNIQLYAGTAVTGTYSWAARSGAGSYESVPAGDQASTTTVAFRVNTYQEDDNDNNAVSALEWDDLVIEIEYTAQVMNDPVNCPVVG